MDENLLYGRLLDDTKSRMHQPRTDDSSMTSKDLEDQFNSSLRRYSRSKKNDNRVDSFGNIRSKFETKTSKSVVDISQSTFSTSQSSLNRQAANASLSRNSGGNIQKIGHVNKSDLIPSESIEWMERSSKRNSSSSVKSKRSDSIVKPFPEHLRVKLRTRPDGAALNKEFAPPFMSSEQDESDRDHLNDNRSLAKPHGVYKDVASSLLDSPNYEKALYVPQYAYNDEGEGDRYDKIDPSSLAKQKVMYQNFDGKILDNLRQSGHDHEYHSSFGRERRVNEADSGRNLEDELDNYCYYQQNDRTSDSLSSAEHLEAMSGSHSTPTNVHAYPYAFSRPSSRDGISNRSGTSIPQGSRVSNGYLESELEMHQNAPFLPYSSESHLGRLEGRLLSRTKSFENRLSASLADVGRSPSPLFKQPPFRPWGQGRDFSPEKRRGRTFSNSYIFDSTRRGSAAGRLSHRPQSAPSGNRTGMSESRSERGRQEGYLNGRFDELHVSESKSKYLHQNQATKDMPYNDPTLFRRGPLDGSKAAAISPSFSSPIERTMSNDYPVMSRYGLFSRPLSAGSQSMLGPRSRSSEMRGAEEYPVRGRTEERQLQPLRPTLQRRPNARLIAGHRPSASPSSSLSETPSKFLRDLHAGVTPGLRETEIIVNSNATETERKRERSNSRGKERSRPVFRPGGTVRDVSLQDYDDRIIEHLNTAYKDAMKSNSPQSRASNLSCDVRERGLRHSSPSCVDNGDPPNPPPDNDLMHNQHYQNGSNERVDIFHDEEIDVDHSDIRAAAMEVMMNMSFTLTPSLDHEQLTDDAEDIDEIISRDGQDVEDVEWVVEKDAVERNEREEGDKGEIFTHIIDEGSSLDDRFVCYPERNDATVSHPRPSASYRPVISSTFPNSTQKNDFHHPINSEEQVEAVSIENEQIPQNSSTLAVLMDDVQLNEVPKTQRSKCRATLNAVSEPKSMTVDDTLGTLPSKGDIKLSDNQMIRLPLDSKPTVRSTGMSRPTVPLKFKAEHGPVSNPIVDPDPILPLGVNPFARIPVQADLKEQSLPDVHTPKREILSVPRADSYPKEISHDVSTLGPHVVPPASFGLEMLKKGVLVKKVD